MQILITSNELIAFKAMMFNGSSGFAQISNSSNLMTPPVTMVVLFKLNAFLPFYNKETTLLLS